MPFCSTFVERLRLQLVVVDQLRRLLLGEQLQRLADLQLARLLALPPPRFWNMPWICEVSSSMPGRREDFHLRLRGRDLDLDFLVVEFAFAQLLAEFLPRRRCSGPPRRGCVGQPELARRRQQRVENALLGRVLGARAAPCASPARASA